MAGIRAFDPLTLPAEQPLTDYERAVRGYNASGGELERGFKSGLYGAVGGGYNATAGAVTEALGGDPSARYAAARNLLRRAGDTRPFVDNWDRVDGPQNFLNYAAGAVGNAVASYTPGLVATALTRRPMVGLGTMFPMEAGETVAQTRLNPEVTNQPSIEELLPVAFGKAAVNTAIESAPWMNVFGKGPLARGLRGEGFGGKVAGHMLGEGATEAAQEVVGQGAQDILQPGRDRSGDLKDIRESFLQGALGSAPFAGASAISGKLAETGERLGEAIDRRFPPKGKPVSVDTVLDDLRTTGTALKDKFASTEGKSADEVLSDLKGAKAEPKYSRFINGNPTAEEDATNPGGLLGRLDMNAVREYGIDPRKLGEQIDMYLRMDGPYARKPGEGPINKAQAALFDALAQLTGGHEQARDVLDYYAKGQDKGTLSELAHTMRDPDGFTEEKPDWLLSADDDSDERQGARSGFEIEGLKRDYVWAGGDANAPFANTAQARTALRKLNDSITSRGEPPARRITLRRFLEENRVDIPAQLEQMRARFDKYLQKELDPRLNKPSTQNNARERNRLLDLRAQVVSARDRLFKTNPQTGEITPNLEGLDKMWVIRRERLNEGLEAALPSEISTYRKTGEGDTPLVFTDSDGKTAKLNPRQILQAELKRMGDNVTELNKDDPNTPALYKRALESGIARVIAAGYDLDPSSLNDSTVIREGLTYGDVRKRARSGEVSLLATDPADRMIQELIENADDNAALARADDRQGADDAALMESQLTAPTLASREDTEERRVQEETGESLRQMQSRGSTKPVPSAPDARGKPALKNYEKNVALLSQLEKVERPSAKQAELMIKLRKQIIAQTPAAERMTSEVARANQSKGSDAERAVGLQQEISALREQMAGGKGTPNQRALLKKMQTRLEELTAKDTKKFSLAKDANDVAPRDLTPEQMDNLDGQLDKYDAYVRNPPQDNFSYKNLIAVHDWANRWKQRLDAKADELGGRYEQLYLKAARTQAAARELLESRKNWTAQDFLDEGSKAEDHRAVQGFFNPELKRAFDEMGVGREAPATAEPPARAVQIRTVSDAFTEMKSLLGWLREDPSTEALARSEAGIQQTLDQVKALLANRDVRMSEKQRQVLEDMVTRASAAYRNAAHNNIFGRKYNREDVFDAGPNPRLTGEQKAQLRAEIYKMLGPTVETKFYESFEIGPSPDKPAAGSFDKDVIKLAIDMTMEDATGTAHHEAMHALFARLLGTDSTQAMRDARGTLLRVASNPQVVKQLKTLLKDYPSAIEQLKEPEEAAAYAFQFWKAGLLDLAPAPRNLFEKIAAWLREVMGAVSQEQKAIALMKALADGKLAEPSTVARVIADMKAKTLGDKAEALLGPLWHAGNAVFISATDRLRDTNLPALEKLADMFHTETDREKGELAFLQKRARIRGERLAALNEMLDGTTPEQRAEALRVLQGREPSTDPLVVAVREYLDFMWKYMDKKGVKRYDIKDGERVAVPLGKVKENYFPRRWDADRVKARRGELLDALRKHAGLSAEQAEGVYQELSQDRDEVELNDGIAYTPFFESAQKRSYDWLNEQNAKHFTQFQKQDLTEILSSYTYQAVHRAEYTEAFGGRGEEIDALIQQAEREGATPQQIIMARKAVAAMTGTLGFDMNPKLKSFMQTAMTYQNIVLLPFALLNNLMDVVGIGVRSGEMKQSWMAFKEGMTGLRKALARDKDPDAAKKLAATIGLIDDAGELANYGMVFDGTYMGSFNKKVNETFFRLNGMSTWNTHMRIAGMKAAQDFILKHRAIASQTQDSPEKEQSLRFLEELNLKPEDVKVFMDRDADGKPRANLKVTQENGLTADEAKKMQEAIFRFVDGAAIRPNAAHRPIWGSDPHWMLVFHLKQFTYSFQQVILKFVAKEARYGNVAPLMIAASYAPFALATNWTKALILGKPIDTSLMGMLGTAVTQSALAGTGNFGLDAWGDLGKNSIPGASFAGPTAGHVITAMQWMAGSPQDSFSDVLLRSTPLSPIVKAVYR